MLEVRSLIVELRIVTPDGLRRVAYIVSGRAHALRSVAHVKTPDGLRRAAYACASGDTAYWRGGFAKLWILSDFSKLPRNALSWHFYRPLTQFTSSNPCWNTQNRATR